MNRCFDCFSDGLKLFRPYCVQKPAKNSYFLSFFLSSFLSFFLSFVRSFVPSFVLSFFLSFFLSLSLSLSLSFIHPCHHSINQSVSLRNSLGQLWIDSVMSVRWCLNNHLLRCSCTSQRQNFIVSACHKHS